MEFRIHAAFYLLLIASFAGCARSGTQEHGSATVTYHLALDVLQEDVAADSMWNSLLDRWTTETSIHVALSAWTDLQTLHPLLMKLRAFPNSEAVFVFDSLYFSQGTAWVDSVKMAFEQGILQCANLGHPSDEGPKQVNDGVMVLQSLAPSSNDDGNKTVLFFEQADSGNGNFLLSIAGDQGLAEAILERIDQLKSARTNLHHLSTRILTDQFEHKFFHYPLSFQHSPLDTLLNQLDVALRENQKPTKLRMFAPHGIDSTLAARLDQLIGEHDIDFKLIAGSRLDSNRVPAQHFSPVFVNHWIPELLLLDGPLKLDALALPVRRQVCLLGTLPCLQAVPALQAGMIVRISSKTLFPMLDNEWLRVWKLGQENHSPVELLGRNSATDF